MNSQEKKRELLKYIKLDQHIDTLITERDRWMSKATRVTTTMEWMPSGTGVCDRVYSAIEQFDKIDREITSEIDRIIELRGMIEQAISSVPDENQQTVLRRKYILGETLEQIAEAMNYSLRHTARLHGRGLEAMCDDVMVWHKEIL